MMSINKLSNLEILNRKPEVEEVKAKKKLPVVLVLDNIRSLYNVGSMFRTADGVGFKKIFLCGITGKLPNREIEKVALGATETVDWEYFESTRECLEKLKSEGYKIWAVELCKESKTFYKTNFEANLALVLGNEVEGVSGDAMEFVEAAVDIPMLGRANSLNVATAFAVVAYEIYRQLTENDGPRNS